MSALKVFAISATIILAGEGAYATSNATTCGDSYGTVLIVDGNVTIKDGIGDVGPAKKQKVIAEISEKTENCLDGPNYVWTKVTVQEVAYDIEENVFGKATVLCTQVQTGISSKKCN